MSGVRLVKEPYRREFAEEKDLFKPLIRLPTQKLVKLEEQFEEGHAGVRREESKHYLRRCESGAGREVGCSSDIVSVVLFCYCNLKAGMLI